MADTCEDGESLILLNQCEKKKIDFSYSSLVGRGLVLLFHVHCHRTNLSKFSYSISTSIKFLTHSHRNGYILVEMTNKHASVSIV